MPVVSVAVRRDSDTVGHKKRFQRLLDDAPDAAVIAHAVQAFPEVMQIALEAHRGVFRRLFLRGRPVWHGRAIGEAIRCAETAIHVNEISLIPGPANAAQARELARIPPEQRAEVWQRVTVRGVLSMELP